MLVIVVGASTIATTLVNAVNPLAALKQSEWWR
jgi:hypothetical protein